MKINSKTTIYALLAFFALLFAVGNIYLVKTVDVFGLPALFILAIVLELFLIIVFVYSLIWVLRTPLHILGSILLSAWKGILTDPYIKRVRKVNSPIVTWLSKRVDPGNPLGLVLSGGVILAAIFFIGFSSILQDVWFHEPLTRIDTRVVNLMPSIRTPTQTDFFRFVTFTAYPQAVILLVLLAGGILWFKRQRVAAGLLLLAFAIEEASAFVLKHLVGRMRPERSLSLIKEDSFSFPSGHTLRATVLFGLLAYFLYLSFKSSLIRLVIILSYLIAIILVALSRVYLGVHYPSDVLASMLFGASLLTLFVTCIEMMIRYKLWGQSIKSFTNKLLGIVPAVIVLTSIILSPILIHLVPVVATPKFIALSTIDETSVQKLPLHSETLTGSPMEPIGFIFVGSQQQIEQLFKSHGWYKADPSTLVNTLKAFSVGFQGHQYLNAPVTPSYVAAKPDDLAFEQPTKSNTLRQRHHIRLWRTNFIVPSGKDIWVATASFDEGIEFAGPAKLPTHRIDPNIDAERDYVVNSLGLKDVSYLQVVKAQAGTNAAGDIYFTDGKAVVVEL